MDPRPGVREPTDSIQPAAASSASTVVVGGEEPAAGAGGQGEPRTRRQGGAQFVPAVRAEEADPFVTPPDPELGGLAGAVAELMQHGQGDVLQGRTDEPLPQAESAAISSAEEAVIHHLQGQPVCGGQRQAGPPGQLTG